MRNRSLFNTKTRTNTTTDTSKVPANTPLRSRLLVKQGKCSLLEGSLDKRSSNLLSIVSSFFLHQCHYLSFFPSPSRLVRAGQAGSYRSASPRPWAEFSFKWGMTNKSFLGPIKIKVYDLASFQTMQENIVNSTKICQADVNVHKGRKTF